MPPVRLQHQITILVLLVVKMRAHYEVVSFHKHIVPEVIPLHKKSNHHSIESAALSSNYIAII
jgi:hypothetical protein